MRAQHKKKGETAGHGRVLAVIPAAGASSRMGGGNKLLMELADMPVLVRTVAVFQASAQIDEIILTCREQDIVPYGKLMQAYGLDKVKNIVRGGGTRTDSVLAGLRACPPDTALVAVHDGARPLVTGEIICAAVEMAWECGAAAPVVPLKDSVKRIQDGEIVADVPRAEIAAVQTPQVFRYALLLEALERAVRDGWAPTDDCAAVEALGATVRATAGSYENIKITTPEDMAMGTAVLQARETLF